MKKEDVLKLEKLAKKIRIRIISNSHKNKIPHLGSCLSVLEILIYLYFHKTRLTKSSFLKNNRDKIILSKGHAAPALFYVLDEKNLLKFNLDSEYRKNISLVGEHPPSPSKIDSIEAATGSLGHGFSISLGLALSNKIRNIKKNVYTILGDGEINEGVIWEGAMFASKNKLNNLYAFIDFNKWQATGRSEDILEISDLEKKWIAFGWNVVSVDGHSFNEIDKAITKFNSSDKPTIIICHTLKGKGVSFMEDDNNWHYKTPNKEELNKAIVELGG